MSSVAKLLAIHMVSIDKLKPNPDNPRIHNRKQRRQIAASIRKFGFLFPIIIDNEGNVIAGHGRIAAATDIGMEEVPAIAPHHIPAALRVAKEISVMDTKAIADSFVQRVDLRPTGMRVILSLASLSADKAQTLIMPRDIPMQMKRRGIEMRLVIEGAGASDANADPVLIRTIARTRAWSEDLLTGRMPSMEAIASRNGVSHSYVKKLMPLAFLAPDIVADIIAGKQPAHLTTQMLIRQIDIPVVWEEQRKMLNNLL